MVNWPITTKTIELVKRKGIIEGKRIFIDATAIKIKNDRRKKKTRTRTVENKTFP